MEVSELRHTSFFEAFFVRYFGFDSLYQMIDTGVVSSAKSMSMF